MIYPEQSVRKRGGVFQVFKQFTRARYKEISHGLRH